MKRLLLDVDGIIGNFTKLYLDCLLEGTGIKKMEDDVDQWDIATALEITPEQDAMAWNILSLPHRAFNIEPYPYAVDAVKVFATLFDVYFVTSPTDSPTWVYDRNQWLRQYFGNLGKKVVHTTQKHICGGDYFVDDKPGAAAEWQEHNQNGVGIIWDRLYNRDVKGPRVKGWNSLFKMLTGEGMP